MTIGDILSLVHSIPEFPVDFSIYRTGNRMLSGLTYDDLVAEDWVLRTSAGTFDDAEKALRALGLNSVVVDTMPVKDHFKMIDSCFVEEYPDDINARGIAVVSKSILDAIPVLSSLVYCDDFKFVQEK